jgi:mevalonate kinase
MDQSLKSTGTVGAIPWQKALDELLLRCPVVVSAPGVFFWAGEHAVLDGAVAVIQQVPLRIYVGLEPLGSAKVSEPRLVLEAGKPLTVRETPHHVYRRDNQAILCGFAAKNREVNLRKVAEVANFLFEDLCQLDGAGRPAQRFRIRTVSELRPGSGVNWSGAFSTALVTALLLITNPRFRREIRPLQQDGVLHWGRSSLSDLVKDPRSWFTRLNRWAWILEATFHEGAGSGYGTLGSLAPSILPIAYRRAVSSRFGELEFPRSVLDKTEEFGSFPSKTLYDRLKQCLGPEAKKPLPYQAFAFRDVHLKPDSDEAALEWPFTYGLIETWWPKSTGDMIRTACEKQDAAMADALEQLENPRINPFGTTATADRKGFGISSCLRRQSPKTLPVLSSRCVHLALAGDAALVCQQLREVLCTRPRPAADSLFKTLAKVHGGLEHLGLAWDAAHLVRGEMVKAFSSHGKHPTTRAITKLSGGGGGGCLMFAMAGRVDSDMIGDLVKTLKNCHYDLPDLPHEPVSPSVIWHSGELLTQEGKGRAFPGVCIEVNAVEDTSWGRSDPSVPSGNAVFLPAGGGYKKATTRLCRIPTEQYLVVAFFGGAWHLLPENEAVLKDVDPTWLSGALKKLGMVLEHLSRKPNAYLDKDRMVLDKDEVVELLGSYGKKNLRSMADHFTALLSQAALFQGRGSEKFAQMTILRHGPLGIALWEPFA